MRIEAIQDGGIYAPGQPAALQQYRENTANHARMAGAQFPSFICRCCGKPKSAIGRKRASASRRDGYKCADCVAAESATACNEVQQ